MKDHFANCDNAVDYFLKFFDDDIAEAILHQSNLYIVQSQRRVPELYALLGINLVMGYHELPSWKNYWNTDPDLSVPFVSSVMPHNRFLQLLSNIHVNDNNSMPPNNTDKLFKLRPLIDKLNNNFMMLYNVSRRVSIDERMILFKGRSSLKQYNPMKPIKQGYKLWSMADMDGYLYKFSVYQGKNGQNDIAGMPPYFGLGDKVVYEMTKSMYGNYHEVYIDNFFTSVPLLEYLFSHQVLCCGTLRTNKKYLPKNLAKDKDLKRGDFDYRVSKDGICVYKWRDNRPVHVISNFHGSQSAIIKRKNKDGSELMILCPNAVKDYNMYMGGVDKANMFCSIYGTSRKSKKWLHRIFFGLIDRAICNAYVVFKKLDDEKCTSLQFRRSVAQSLLTIARPPKVGRPLSSPAVPSVSKRRKSNYSVPASIRKENRGVHWPIYKKNRGRCEVCSNKKIESRPHFQCSACNVFLCINDKKNCFVEYHDAK